MEKYLVFIDRAILIYISNIFLIGEIKNSDIRKGKSKASAHAYINK